MSAGVLVEGNAFENVAYPSYVGATRAGRVASWSGATCT